MKELRFLTTSTSNIEPKEVKLIFDKKRINEFEKRITSKEDTKGSLSREKCFKVIEKIKTMNGMEHNEDAMFLITGLLQRGGSNKSAGNTIFNMNEFSISSSDLHKAIASVEKQGTIRQFARTMADDIYEFAVIMQEEGDLAKQIKLQITDLSIHELAWCSNFQTRNTNCPKKVRSWLVENYQKRFRS